jgi:hypothetical protein
METRGLGVGYILLLGFLAYAAFKFYRVQQAIAVDLRNRNCLQPGVSYYCNLAVTQRPAQVLAFAPTNSDAATPVGYAPAFGPVENMPSQNQEVFF